MVWQPQQVGRVGVRRIRPGSCRTLAPFGVVLVALLYGCAPERPKSVPPSAHSVAKQSGSGAMTFTAPDDGTVYVYDRSKQKMMYAGRLARGDVMQVDARGNEIRVDGRAVSQGELRDLNEYQIWFDTEGPSGKRIDLNTERP
jgi:hypothetical protein